MLIDDDEKRENSSTEYSLMKIEYSLKIKTKFEWEQKKLNLILKKFQINSFYLTWKKSEDKIFDSILEKIPDKNDIYYLKNGEEMNTVRLIIDPKKS